MVAECIRPGMSVSLVARRHGISASLLFKWKKLMNDGGYSAIESGDEVVRKALDVSRRGAGSVCEEASWLGDLIDGR